MKRIAIFVPLAFVALAACGDNGAKEKAAAEARAAAQAAHKAELLEGALALNTRCYAAVKWQQRLLDSPVPRSIAGGSTPFLDYYRKMIADKLGDQVVAAEGAKPELSKANLDAYLDWAAKDQAAKIFDKGNRTQNYTTVTTCVQSAAEFGTGTMAKISPAERLGKIQQLRQIMDATGS